MNTTDILVQKIAESIELKKSEIAKLEKPSYNTNCSLTIDGNTYNLHIQPSDVLVKLLSKLYMKCETYKLMISEYNLNVKPYSHQGFSFDDWKEDILTKINILDITTKRKELKEDEYALSKLLSPEQQRKLEAEMLAKKYKINVEK